MAEEEQPKDLNYIPEVILKKRKHSEAWALSKKAQLQKKSFQLRKTKDFIKKPEDFIFEYRNREIDLIRMKRRVKWRRGDKSRPSNMPIIVIRIQGYRLCFFPLCFVSVNSHNIFLLLYLFLGNKTCMLQPESICSVWD